MPAGYKTKPEDIQDSYGFWTVLRKEVVKSKVLCKCICGKEKYVRLYHLKIGASTNCNCQNISKEIEYDDSINGLVIGKNKIISNEIRRDSQNAKIVLCECLCESKTQRWRRFNELKRNPNKGCLECYESKGNFKHGMSPNGERSRIYRIWRNMITRCQNPNFDKYKYYGGKGIQVYEEWKDFINFYEWSINNGYNDDLTIDRINSNGNYEPSNCRFISLSEQNHIKDNENKNGYKGVSKKRNRWSATIHHNGIRYYLGSFLNPEDAARAYNEKAKELYGQYAQINEIEGNEQWEPNQKT